jgi:hypothetical protein
MASAGIGACASFAVARRSLVGSGSPKSGRLAAVRLSIVAKCLSISAIVSSMSMSPATARTALDGG